MQHGPVHPRETASHTTAATTRLHGTLPVWSLLARTNKDELFGVSFGSRFRRIQDEGRGEQETGMGVEGFGVPWSAQREGHAWHHQRPNQQPHLQRI